jgi:hypothetical protein
MPQTRRSAQPIGARLNADVALAQFKMNWRLAHDWQLIGPGPFEHGMRLMEEVGRLLGAWLKQTRANAAAARASPAPKDRSSEAPRP